jgi:hypothetical protein
LRWPSSNSELKPWFIDDAEVIASWEIKWGRRHVTQHKGWKLKTRQQTMKYG